MKAWRPAMRRVWRRLVASVRPDAREDELAREVEAHLALLEDDFRASGMSRNEARLAARRAFGGVEQVKERHRDTRAFRWIDDARRDAAYAWRSLARTPAFAATAVLTLAIGIGASTAIYSVVDAVLLQPLPFPDADRLVRIVENQRPRTLPPMSYQEYREWLPRSTTMEGLAAGTFNPQVLMQTREGAIRLAGALVSPNYFDVLRVPILIGRLLAPSDESDPGVVVLAFDTWQRHFHGDAAAVGSTIELRLSSESRLFTIVGVLPEGLVTPVGDVDYFMPVRLRPGDRPLSLTTMFGRLRDGVSLSAAAEEADAIGVGVRAPRPADAPALTGARFRVENLRDFTVAPVQPALRVLLVAVAVMLLLVCANVANLLLARGTARHREIAMRRALGASRSRIVRQVFTECMVLAVAGGVLGIGLAAVGVTLVKRLATVEAPGVFRLVFGTTILPRAGEVGVDLRLLAVAFALSALACAVFGLLPALHLSRSTGLQAIGVRGSAGTRGQTRARAVLVLVQMALATMLLVGAGLLARSFVNLSQVEKGYDPEHVLAFQLVFPAEHSTVRKALTIEALLARLRATPGVENAGFAYAGILLSIEDTVGVFVPPGRTLDELQSAADKPRLKSLSRGYLPAVGVRLLSGRHLDERDGATAPPAVLLNRTVARRYFGDANPVGTLLAWHNGTGAPAEVRIVGVVDDVRQGRIERAPYAEIFMDYRQVLALEQRWGVPPQRQEALAFGFLSFAVRTRGDPAAFVPVVHAAVKAVDPATGIDAIIPMTRLVANSVARPRFYAVLLGVFAAVAGLLAAIGIYGVLAYSVLQRTQEIGVRMALGAGGSQVLRLVLGKGLALTALGIGLGLAGAVAGAGYLRSLLFGIEPLDIATFTTVAAAFTAVAALASYLPARRATQVDPVSALRAE